MPIVCDPEASARPLTLGVPGDVHTADTTAAAAQLLDGNPSETLVVVGPHISADDAMAFAASLRLSRPHVGVILIRIGVDVSLLTQALQAGVREVVSAGDEAALAAACRRSAEVSQRMRAGTPGHPGQGKIITVFAAKGGCGKTTLSVNLGVALSAGTSKRVCLVDLDLEFGDVAMSMHLDPVRTIVDAVSMAGHIDTVGAASLLTHYQQGLEVLLAPVTPSDAEKVPPSLARELLTVLAGMFDYVVVDTPAQLSEHVLTAFDVSDEHVLLTTLDVLAVKNLRVTLDMLDMLNYPKQIRSVVLNRSDSKVGLSLDDVAKVMGSPVAAQIPSSRAVPVSINKGTPITLDSPRHPVSQAITGFANRRLLDQGVAPARRRSLSRRARRSG